MGKFRTGLKQPKTKSQSIDTYRKVTKGWKSRGNWKIGMCLRDCQNKPEKCGQCFRFDMFIPNKEE